MAAKITKSQALVEFALILPLLLILLFGIVEFGRIFSTGLIVSHSAREGARAGSVGAGDSAIISRVQETAGVLDITRLNIEIEPEEADRERGVPFSVHVSYPVTVTLPFIAVVTGKQWR